MFPFMRWIRSISSPRRPLARRSKRRERVQLTVEHLEERRVPTIFFKPQFGAETQNGSISQTLSDPVVQLIYWGPSGFWTQPVMNQYTSAAGQMLSSGFLGDVTQYGSDGRTTFFGGISDTDALPSQLDEYQSVLELGRLTAQGKLPSIPGRTAIYAFVTALDAKSNVWPQGFDSGNVVGYNWTGGSSTTGLIWDGWTNSVNTFTLTLSHELAEEMSSPDGNGFEVNPGSGWYNQTSHGQIGDYEGNLYSARLNNGVQVQPIWSNQDQAFVVMDGSPLKQFYLTPHDSPKFGTTLSGTTFVNGENVNGYDLDILANQGAAANDQITISTLTNPVDTTTSEIAITVNGETAWFDTGSVTIDNLNIYGGTGLTTLTLNGLGALPAGGNFNISTQGDLKVVYTGVSPVQQQLNVGLTGKLTVAVPRSVSVSISSNLITVPGDAVLQYATLATASNGQILQAPKTLEIDGGDSTYMVLSTPSAIPLTIATTDVNNSVVLDTVSEPVVVTTALGDNVTATVQSGNQLSLVSFANPSSMSVAISANGVEYRNCVSITLTGMQGLSVNGYSGSYDYAVQSTPAFVPLTITTNSGTNTVDVAGASDTVTVYAEGSDTVNVGGPVVGSRKLDQLSTVSVNGDGSTTLTINDQDASWTNTSTTYDLTAGSVSRVLGAVSVSYTGLANLTLNASNNGANYVTVETTAVPTTINGGTATSGIRVAPSSQNLDGIKGLLSLSGPSAAVYVYDQADPHAASGPIAYTVGNYVTRTANIGGVNTTTNIVAVPVASVTLYTSQTSGSSPNTVSVGGLQEPGTVDSGSADAFTLLGYGVPLTIDAHGGTVTLDDHTLQNSVSGGTTDTFTLGYTVTNQTVVRNEHWHETEIIDWSQIPTNPLNGSTPHPAVVSRDWYFNGTLNYKNVSNLTLDGGQVGSTFTVQSTPTDMPVKLNGIGSDQFFIGNSGSVKNILSRVSIQGTAKDTLVVDDSKATTTDKVTVTPTQVGVAGDQFFVAGGGLSYSGLASLTLNLSHAASDKVVLTPSATTALFINGDPTEFSAGLGAELDLLGAINAQLTSTGAGAGKWTSSTNQFAPVTFSGIATTHSS